MANQMQGETNILLDYLIVEKCVSFLKQKFCDDLSQKQVNRQFGTLLQAIYDSKITVSLEVESNFDFKSANLILTSQRWKENITINAVSKTELNTTLVSIFTCFKRFLCLTINHMDNWQDDFSLEVLSQTILKENCRPNKVRRLKILDPDDKFEPISVIIISLAPILKVLSIWCDFYYETGELLPAISTCINLRKLKVMFTKRRLPASFRDCVSKLRNLEYFQYNDLDVNANWLLCAFQDNHNLRTLCTCWPAGGLNPAQLCDPSIQSIISRLRAVGIDKCGFLDMNDEPKRNQIRHIWSLVTSHIVVWLSVADAVFAADSSYSNIIEVLRAWLELSNLACKAVHLLIVGKDDQFNDELNSAVSALMSMEEYAGLTVIRSPRKIVLRCNNANIVLKD